MNPGITINNTNKMFVDSTPDISIIIVNYNGKRFISNCIKSLLDNITLKYEIILVDNNSHDTSVEIIKNEFPQVVIIQNTENVGFALGNNIGVNASKGKYLLLLNNDTMLLTDIKDVITHFNNYPRTGVVGGKVSYEDGKYQKTMGLEHTPIRIVSSWLINQQTSQHFPYLSRTIQHEKNYSKQVEDIAWVSGAFLFTTRSIWEKIGGMDSNYFMYMEDVDYCKKVRQIGYIISYLPNIKIIHYEGSGRPWLGTKALIYTIKSYKVFIIKYHRRVSLIFTMILLSIVMLIRSILFIIISMVNNKTINIEKSIGYFKVSFYCIKSLFI